MRMGTVLIICDEPDKTCEFCSKVKDTRPYGPGGKQICFDCGMSPGMRATVEKNLSNMLEGKPPEHGEGS